jgi:adenosylmethionine-8-amino-7-oxononanoate aminotransferase
MVEPSVTQLETWDREHVWHAFTQMAEHVPFLIREAHGCTLVDVQGRAYLDGVSSLWCNIHGHRHPRLDAAIRRQLAEVAHVTLLGMAHPTTVKLARRLAELAPGLPHVFFSDSGASAVEVALKMAFQYWQQCERPQPRKTKFLAFENAYHGDTLGSVSVGGVARFHEMFRPLLFDVIRLPAPDTYRLPPGVTREFACEHYLRLVEDAVKEHRDELAAVVIEPLVQAAAGMLMHLPGFLAGVREITRRHDVLLIADEVAVGMGRTGTMFACEQEQVAPDFLCLAKGLTGGYLPLAATMATDEIWRTFLGKYEESKTFFHGHTYGGNPLGAAVALATLDVFEEEQTLIAMQPKVQRLAEHLARISKHPHIGDVRQRGLMAGIELVRDKGSQEPYPWSEQRGIIACRHALAHGVWLRSLGNVVVILPPLAISLGELDRICLAAEAGIIEATGNGTRDTRP